MKKVNKIKMLLCEAAINLLAFAVIAAKVTDDATLLRGMCAFVFAVSAVLAVMGAYCISGRAKKVIGVVDEDFATITIAIAVLVAATLLLTWDASVEGVVTVAVGATTVATSLLFTQKGGASHDREGS